MEYRILTSTNEKKLEERVNALLKEGWRPQGGFMAVDGSSSWYYWQAMIKENK